MLGKAMLAGVGGSGGWSRMMRFTVVWEQELDDAVANAWIAGDTEIRRTLPHFQIDCKGA